MPETPETLNLGGSAMDKSPGGIGLRTRFLEAEDRISRDERGSIVSPFLQAFLRSGRVRVPRVDRNRKVAKPAL